MKRNFSKAMRFRKTAKRELAERERRLGTTGH
jgi:hypothetical protein